MYQGQLVCQRPQRSWQHTRPAAFPASLFYRRQGLWRFGEKKVRMAGLTRQPGSAPAAGFTPPVVCRPVKPCFSLHMKDKRSERKGRPAVPFVRENVSPTASVPKGRRPNMAAGRKPLFMEEAFREQRRGKVALQRAMPLFFGLWVYPTRKPPFLRIKSWIHPKMGLTQGARTVKINMGKRISWSMRFACPGILPRRRILIAGRIRRVCVPHDDAALSEWEGEGWSVRSAKIKRRCSSSCGHGPETACPPAFGKFVPPPGSSPPPVCTPSCLSWSRDGLH